MGDFSSSRIVGVADRESEDESAADRPPTKRKPNPEEKPKPDASENEDLVIEPDEKHDLDEMA
jgi:hypothetical protein